ncbi:MFS transporter [Simkania negevensis]|uniref:MFS transporter n=1 Tax=Simkania negevensis TaxID=83561 RepID=UPI0013052EC3|nr:MFS transporter [Simkania negevensis]
MFSDVISENYISIAINTRPQVEEYVLILSLFVLQICIAPIQAAFSDYYCRKKSLCIAIMFCLISLIIVALYNINITHFLTSLIIIILLKGLLGNIIPISLAAVADTQNKNFRFSFGVITSAYAIGYMLMIFANLKITTIQANFLAIIFLLLSLALCITKFKDRRDKDHPSQKEKRELLTKEHSHFFFAIIKFEVILLIKDLKNKCIVNGLLAFLLWEVSLYSVLLLYVDFKIIGFADIALAMMIGYLFGVITLRFTGLLSNKVMIRIAYVFQCFSLMPFIMHSLFNFSHVNLHLLTGCYFFHAFGNAMIAPTLFAMFAKQTEHHQMGKIYGLIESTDTLAFLISFLTILTHKSFNYNVNYMVLISFIFALISWIPYKIFEKNRPKIIQTTDT